MDKKWFNIAFNAKEDASEINIYDQIGAYGVSASQFLVDLKNLDGSKRLKVRINSPGGDVFDGMAIYNLLEEYEGGVEIVIDGLAASIASVIAMAGDKITMHETAMFMIHKPWTFTMGDSDQLRKDADLLDKIQNQILLSYKKNSKIDDNELNDLVNAETWLSAEEALEYGFITDIYKEKKKKNKLENKVKSFSNVAIFDKFTNIPSKIAACLIKNEEPKTEEPVPPAEEPVEEPKIEPETEKEPKQKEDEMTPEEIKKQQDEAVKAAVVAEKNRQAEIRAAGKKLNISEVLIENAIEKELPVADASKLFIDEFSKSTSSVTGATISVKKDEADKFRAQNVASLCAVSGLVSDRAEREAGLKNGGAKSLHSLYRTYLASKGKKTEHLDGESLVREVHNELTGVSTSDLTSVLQDTLNKALDTSMTAARTTFQLWTKTKSVKDFRQFSLAKLSGVSDVKEIKENASFTIGSLSDKKEVGTLATKGIYLPLSRQAQINDDLGALVDMGSMLGMSIMRGQNRDCYDYLFSNPTMTEDSVSLFDVSTHGNYITSGGAAPSSTTLDAAQLAMMTRSKIKGNPADKTEPTGVMPRFVIVPAKHKGATERLVYSQTYPSSLTTYVGVFNQYNAQGTNPLQVVCEPYLDSLDADQWYVAADPNEIATIVRLTLNGNESPFIEQDRSRGTEPLGMMFRCYYDWAFMAGDWRGLYANDGD